MNEQRKEWLTKWRNEKMKEEQMDGQRESWICRHRDWMKEWKNPNNQLRNELMYNKLTNEKEQNKWMNEWRNELTNATLFNVLLDKYDYRGQETYNKSQSESCKWRRKLSIPLIASMSSYGSF